MARGNHHYREGLLLAAVSLAIALPGYAAEDATRVAVPSAVVRARSSRVSGTQSSSVQARVAAAEKAKAARDLDAILGTSRALAATCLRQMAQVKNEQGAKTEAADLFRESLQYEDGPDFRSQLSLLELNAGHFEQALRAIEQSISLDANNATAWSIQSTVWMHMGQAQKAAEALRHSLALQPRIETAYSLGIALLAARDKQGADAVFAGMLKDYGESGAIHVLFARAYRNAEYPDDQWKSLQRAIALDPGTPHAHYFLGLAYLERNEWAPSEDAGREFLKELESDPDDYLCNYVLGALYSSQYRYDESDRYLKAAALNKRAGHEVWLYLGLNAYSRRREAEAEKYLREAVARAKGRESEAHYLIRKGYVALGRILSNSGRKEEAQPYFQKAREFENLTLRDSARAVEQTKSRSRSGTPSERQQLADAADSASASVPTGIVQADGAVENAADPGPEIPQTAKPELLREEERLRGLLGAAFQDMGTVSALRLQDREALAYYHQAERWTPQERALLDNIATAAFRLSDYPETIRALSKRSQDVSDVRLRGMLGTAHFATGAYRSALRAFAPLGQAGMRDPAIGYFWATSFAKTGEFKQATEVLEALEQTNLAASTLLLTGQLWNEMHDFEHAVRAFHRALRLEPGLPKAHFYAGVALLQLNRYAEAEEECKAELALVPGDPDAAYNLGFAYLQQSRRDEALEMFRSVASSHPDHARSQYQLGKLLLARGEFNEAVEHLEVSARLDPDADYVHYELQVAYRKQARKDEADRELRLYRAAKDANRRRTDPRPVEAQ